MTDPQRRCPTSPRWLLSAVLLLAGAIAWGQETAASAESQLQASPATEPPVAEAQTTDDSRDQAVDEVPVDAAPQTAAGAPAPDSAAEAAATAAAEPDAPQEEEPWVCHPNPDPEGTGWICEVERPNDWFEPELLPEELQTRQCIRCGGRYMDPLSTADTNISLEEFPVEATANATELKGEVLRLTGGVDLQQGYRTVRGDEVFYNRETGVAMVEGDITLREKGMLLRGDEAELDPNADIATLRGGTYILHNEQLRGSAEELRRDADGMIYIDNGAFTFCAPVDNDWEFATGTLTLDFDEGVGVARSTKLKVKDVPVFYLPYLSFPINDQRRSGVLWPSIGYDSRGGLDVAVPVYWNIKENYDFTYVPRYIEQRGLYNEGEFRYLGRNIGMWSIGGAYIAKDDRFVEDYPEFEREDRWLAQVQHNNLINNRWLSRVDYTEVSDPFYLRDLETTSIDTRRQANLRQQANLDYLGDRILVNVELQQFQPLADDIRNDYKKLPQITATYRDSNQPFRLNPVLLGQYSDFDTDDDRRVTGERYYAEAGLKYPMQWNYGFLNSELKYRQISYQLNGKEDQDELVNSDPGAPMLHVDGGLYFEREVAFDGKPTIQTLEPRVAYLWSEFTEQTGNPDFDSSELTFNQNQLFRQTRFSGRDRIDDSDQVSVGLTTRFIDGFTGAEWLSAYIGQIFYFRDRLVRLRDNIDGPITNTSSEYATGAAWEPNDLFKLRTNLVYDPNTGKMNNANFNARFKPDNGAIYNFGYSFRRELTNVINRDTTDQVTLSTYLPLWKNWGVFGSFSYSFEQQTSVEDMIGFEYDTCCWRVRLMHLRYFDSARGFIDFDDPNLRREESTQVQIALKGLGGFGTRVEGIMERMIRGYRRSAF